MRALPGVAPQSTKYSPQFSGRLVPELPDPIPADVLAHPIVGEVRRFDGSVAPGGWMTVQGQTLSAADNRPLHAILGRTSSSATTFTLSKPRFGLIIAVAGAFPTSPDVFKTSARHMTHADGLGPGAIAQGPRMPKQPSDKVLAERRLATSQMRVSRSPVVPVSAELAARVGAATFDARTEALALIGAENAARLQAAIGAIADGRMAPYDAATQFAPSLSYAQAASVMQINDAVIRRFNDRWQGSPPDHAQVNATYFLISVVITPEQTRKIAIREQSEQRR